MRDGLLGLGQTGRHRAAHAVQRHLDERAVRVHLHNRLGTQARRHRRLGRDRRRGNRCWRCRRSQRRHRACPFNIRPHNAPMRTRAGNLRQVQPLFLGNPPRQRRGKDPRARCRRNNRRRRGRNRSRSRRRSGFSPILDRRRRLGHSRTRRLALLQQHGNRGVHLDPRRALGHQNLADGAFIHRLKFHRGLVGLNLGNHLPRLHHIALFHQPLGQRALLHGRRQRGHQNFHSHVPLPYR